MALADTANLVVMLKLDDKFSGPLRGVNKQLNQFVQTASVRGGLENIGAGLGLGLKRSAIIGGVGLAALTVQIKAGVESLRELENANAQTVAALESTGGASGQTLKSIRALSEEYETLGGVIDDKVIQAGANVLLTFRHIEREAFEPALEQALNLSTALGQDLQTSILQVGKALEDPVRGVTALRRAGVQLTTQQEKQIKTLVEQNDLYGAQKIILGELERQVGGRFAAAGKTNEATVARMGDAFEDLQQTLAVGFLPAIDRIAVRLQTLFADPAVIRRVEEFGATLAGFLNEENLDRAGKAVEGVFGFLGAIPWDAISSGISITAQAAQKAVDVFRSLPPGVQNALITLLAANTLTGGLVAKGLGELAAVALKSLTTITAGNVTVIGGRVAAPGGPGGGPVAAPAGGGTMRALVTNFAALAGIPLTFVAADMLLKEFQGAQELGGEIRSRLDNIDTSTLAGANERLALIDAQIEKADQNMVAQFFGLDDKLRWGFETEREQLIQTRNTLQGRLDGLRYVQELNRRANERAATASEITSRKDFSPRFTANVTANVSTFVSAANVVQQTASYNFSVGGSNDGGSFVD